MSNCFCGSSENERMPVKMPISFFFFECLNCLQRFTAVFRFFCDCIRRENQNKTDKPIKTCLFRKAGYQRSKCFHLPLNDGFSRESFIDCKFFRNRSQNSRWPLDICYWQTIFLILPNLYAGINIPEFRIREILGRFFRTPGKVKIFLPRSTIVSFQSA